MLSIVLMNGYYCRQATVYKLMLIASPDKAVNLVHTTSFDTDTVFAYPRVHYQALLDVPIPSPFPELYIV